MINIMSVDLEDYYCDLPFSSWNQYESRIINLTARILNMFDKYNVHATFFVLGYIAERHPELIEEVTSRGHEIASHSYSHPNLKNTNKGIFESDLIKSLEVLRRISGQSVLGYRAPYFSINKHNLWCFDILKKHLCYDSSIFPVKFHYGMAEAPRHIYKVSDTDALVEDPNCKFIEIPMTTLKLSRIGNFPIAGGHYLRFLPYQILKTGIEKFNKAGQSAVFYIHPKDLDPETPHIPGNQWHNYWGIKGAAKKFEAILARFKFSSVRELLNF